jgi:NAD(P)H-hydrate epimerase
MVVDADALTALTGGLGLCREAAAPRLLTPHPGVAARLLGCGIAEVQADRLGSARRLAAESGAVVALKGARTVVAQPDGRATLNSTGNPGMATGGTGDVLTGMIAAWLAQLLDADAACRLAVFLHGAAGDLAAGHEGRVSMIAGDLINHIGPALEQLSAPPAGNGGDH